MWHQLVCFAEIKWCTTLYFIHLSSTHLTSVLVKLNTIWNIWFMLFTTCLHLRHIILSPFVFTCYVRLCLMRQATIKWDSLRMNTQCYINWLVMSNVTPKLGCWHCHNWNSTKLQSFSIWTEYIITIPIKWTPG